MATTADIGNMGRTTIQVPEELADELHDRKERGESYADVIYRLIEQAEGGADSRQRKQEIEEPEPALREPEPETEGKDDPREILLSMDLPGSGEDYERRVESVLEIYHFLQSNPGERLSKSDFRELLEDEDVGYAGGFGSLWSNWVKSNPAQGHGENVLCSLPGVELRGNDYIYQEQS